MASLGAAATSSLVVLGGLGIAFVSASLYGRVAALSWERTPYPTGKLVNAEGTRFFVRIKGKGTPVVVIEPTLGSPGAEWWHVQDELARTTTVVTYDRAGYGWSKPGRRPRTSRQIVDELHAMLAAALLPGPYVLIGHGQGGLYLQLFGRRYPEEVAGAVFLDPVSSDNQRFKSELKQDVFRSSGVDRFTEIRSLRLLQQLGMMRVFRSVVERGLLAYDKGLPAATREVIWQHFTLPKAHVAISDEYAQNSTPANSSDVRAAGQFSPVPLKVLFHSPRRMVQRMMKQGDLQREDADEAEMIWEQLARAYLRLSPQSEWIVAGESGHFIHLDQPELVVSEARELIDNVRQAAFTG